MKILRSLNDFKAYRASLDLDDNTIGFVPTMGALHEGHLSLIREAKRQCKIVICSIFVNPTQFNDPSDLDKYPRVEDQDISLLAIENTDAVWLPGPKDIYPNDLQLQISFGRLESIMEGAKRPGHFNGVGLVILKLFHTVRANKAFFGKKDYQQLSIVRYLCKELFLPVEIIGCETVREQDGLAMSSRNIRIPTDLRKDASALFNALLICKASLIKTKNVTKAVLRGKELLSSHKGFTLEYLEIREASTLGEVKDFSSTLVICIAAFLGGVRLIDNLEVTAEDFEGN